MVHIPRPGRGPTAWPWKPRARRKFRACPLEDPPQRQVLGNMLRIGRRPCCQQLLRAGKAISSAATSSRCVSTASASDKLEAGAAPPSPRLPAPPMGRVTTSRSFRGRICSAYCWQPSSSATWHPLLQNRNSEGVNR